MIDFDIEHCIAIGIDLSFSSTALVALNCKNGEVIHTAFETSKKKFVDPEMDILKVRSRGAKDVDLYIAERRYSVVSFLENVICNHLDLSCGTKIFVALEGYAMSAHSTRSLETAELCGSLRNALYAEGIAHRIYDPLSIKLFATGNGFAKKVEMVKAASESGFTVRDEFFEDGEKFKQSLFIDGKVYDRDVKGPGADLCDAFHIASFLKCELMLRKGLTTLAELKDHQRKVFLRVTKGNPINLLDKPFIEKQEEVIKRRKIKNEPTRGN